MNLQQKRIKLHEIVRDTLNGRDHIKEGCVFGYANYNARKERGLSYGPGDFMTQEVHLGKILGGALGVYAGFSGSIPALVAMPFAYGIGRGLDLAYKTTKYSRPSEEYK